MTKSRNRINGEGGWVNAGNLATTSGTLVLWSGIPAWATEVVLDLNGVSLNGTDHLEIRIGPVGGLVSSGYTAGSNRHVVGSPYVSSRDVTTDFPIYSGGASRAVTGRMTIRRLTGNVYVSEHTVRSASTQDSSGGGSVDIGGDLEQLRLSRSGSDSFDSGSATLFYR